jgi:purine-binding chemotaxis protein CheW
VSLNSDAPPEFRRGGRLRSYRSRIGSHSGHASLEIRPELVTRPGTVSSSVATTCSRLNGSGLDLVIFPLGPQRYAIEAARVQEVVRAVAVALLPKAPSIVEGVINVRGRVVPVLDLARRLHHATREAELSDHFVIARATERLVAFRAQGTVTLEHVEPGLIEDARAHAPGAAHVTGIAKLPDGLVFIHDLETFLSVAEAGVLKKALSEAHTERATT